MSETKGKILSVSIKDILITSKNKEVCPVIIFEKTCNFNELLSRFLKKSNRDERSYSMMVVDLQ